MANLNQEIYCNRHGGRFRVFSFGCPETFRVATPMLVSTSNLFSRFRRFRVRAHRRPRHANGLHSLILGTLKIHPQNDQNQWGWTPSDEVSCYRIGGSVIDGHTNVDINFHQQMLAVWFLFLVVQLICVWWWSMSIQWKKQKEPVASYHRERIFPVATGWKLEAMFLFTRPQPQSQFIPTPGLEIAMVLVMNLPRHGRLMVLRCRWTSQLEVQEYSATERGRTGPPAPPGLQRRLGQQWEASHHCFPHQSNGKLLFLPWVITMINNSNHNTMVNNYG